MNTAQGTSHKLIRLYELCGYCYTCEGELNERELNGNSKPYCPQCSPDRLTTDKTVCQICFNKMPVVNFRYKCANRPCLEHRFLLAKAQSQVKHIDEQKNKEKRAYIKQLTDRLMAGEEIEKTADNSEQIAMIKNALDYQKSATAPTMCGHCNSIGLIYRDEKIQCPTHSHKYINKYIHYTCMNPECKIVTPFDCVIVPCTLCTK